MKQTENIKQMDISLGGGIFGEKTRIDTINHPVLVIGLGGTGTDALLRLKYQVSRRFKGGVRRTKPDNIEFLSLETNEHDRKKYKGVSLETHTETVLLSNAGIGAILNNRSTLPDYISSWLSPELTITDGTKGASGNRQAGRLLLFEKINTAIDAINNKIKSLRTDQENKLLVFILSGLSGGTGGGMFLDVAYIVRGLMEREYGAKGIDKVEITGWLFTPDVHLAGNNMNIHTEEYIQRNGYAALKELDYFMNIEERGERFCQKYGTRLEVNSALAPFNLCHLVSACNIDGVFVKNAYDYCMNVSAENIVNFLAFEEKESGSEFAVQDYHSNLVSNISAMKSNLPQGMTARANFSYNIIGASAAVLPTEGLNSHVAAAMFRELSPMFEAEADDFELQQFSQALEISALGAEIARNLPPIKLDFAETDYFSYANVIKTRRVNIEEKLAEQFSAAKRNLANTREITAAAIEKIKRGLREAFLNPKQGPFYASRLIFSDRSPCLTARLAAYREHLREKISRCEEEAHAQEISAEARLEEARKAFFLTRESKKNAYIEAVIKIFQTRLQKEIFAKMIEMYKEISTAVSAEHDSFYGQFEGILQEVDKVLRANDARIGEVSPEKTFHHDVISVRDATAEIENHLKEIGFEALARDFYKYIHDESQKWLEDSLVTESLSNFVCDRFEILTRSMPQFLSFRYGDDRAAADITETEIAPQLYRDARPIFHMDNAAGIFNFPSYGVVSVPANAPEIARGIEAYQHHALANLRFNIRKSSITDRVFWLNTQNGVPLFAYAPIRVYEELYERTICAKEGVGRHLCQDWLNLPSPIPENLWGDTYSNPRQKTLNEESRQIFKQGLNSSVIREKNGRFHTDAKTIWLGTVEEAEDFFIRCPELIDSVKMENSKRSLKLTKNLFTV